MYHSRPQITAEIKLGRRVESAHKYLIVGEFPICGDKATKLAVSLGQSGKPVVTLSARNSSSAHVQLQFKSRRLWAKTLTAIDQATSAPISVFIHPAGLGLQEISKPRWQNRRMEEWRRFLLAYRIAARAKNCTIVMDKTAKWFAISLSIAIFSRNPFTTRLCVRKSSTSKLIERMSNSSTEAIPVGIGGSAGKQFSSGALRYQAAKLERKDPVRPLLVADLRWVQDATEALEHISPQLLPNIESRNADIEKFRLANQIPKGQSLSIFMQHYFSNAELTNFVNSPDDLITWYLHAPINRKSNPALPIPHPILVNAFSGSEGSTPVHLRGPILNLANHIEYGPHELKTIAGRSAFLVELILDLARRCEDLNFLPSSLLTYFRTPVGGETGNVSRMELICFLLSTESGASGARNLWDCQQIMKWFRQTICSQAPSMEIFSTADRPCNDTAEPNNVQIFGIVGDQSGLARNTQMSADAFTSLDIPIDVGSKPFNSTWRQASAKNLRHLNRPVTLHHVNADKIPSQILAASPSLHIGFVLWELEQIPPSHLLAGKMLDEVWVPSSYVQKIYANASECNVVNVGKGFSLPDVKTSDLNEYALNAEHCVFLMCFDAHSSVERKNPLAAVLAFRAAFPDDPDVRLIIKTTPVSPGHWGDPNGQMQQIREFARRDSRIIVDQRMLPFGMLLSLIKRADCVVSPHRAEGFGYIPAYALWFGRPVIATDYSGTQDICTAETAFPVPYKLIETRIGETITQMESAHWADIEIEALSHTLRKVRNNPVDAQIKALRGQNLLRTKYSPEMQAKRYLERFEALGIVTK